MTPPTPEQITALEQWARQTLDAYGTALADDIRDICTGYLAIVASWRKQQAELAHWQTCSGCGENMDAPGHCPNAEAEWNKAQMEVAEQALNERDAARAEAAQLRDTLDALTNGQLGQMREEGQ